MEACCFKVIVNYWFNKNTVPVDLKTVLTLDALSQFSGVHLRQVKHLMKVWQFCSYGRILPAYTPPEIDQYGIIC
jgi:hypothetical protein